MCVYKTKPVERHRLHSLLDRAVFDPIGKYKSSYHDDDMRNDRLRYKLSQSSEGRRCNRKLNLPICLGSINARECAIKGSETVSEPACFLM